jgi:nucleoid-associated protein YgaU
MTDGRPVRARVTVSFSEFIDGEREAKEVNRQTADFSKVHAVVGDETLSDLAAKFYNNAQTWRPIAIANGIDDPRSVFPGQILRIPSLPFVDQE